MESLQTGNLVTQHTTGYSFPTQIVKVILDVNLQIDKSTILLKELLQNNIEEFRKLIKFDSRELLEVEWWSKHITQFCLEALRMSITKKLLVDLITVGFIRISESMIQQGFNVNEIVQLIFSSLSNGLSVTNLQSFLNTSNAISTCRNLKTKWIGASEVGAIIGLSLIQRGAPSPEQLVTMMDYAHQHNWPAVHIINAVQAAEIGEPNWSEVLRYLPYFLVHNSGRSAGNGSLGGPTLASQLTTSSMYGGSYSVKVKVTKGRIEHVQNGHTFEFFDFSYQNCTRHRYSSFYPAGTNIDSRMIPLPGYPSVLTFAADTVAWRGFSKSQISSDVIGIGEYRPYGREAGRRFYPNTGVTQLYPQTGIKIFQKELVAIGRLLGRI